MVLTFFAYLEQSLAGYLTVRAYSFELRNTCRICLKNFIPRTWDRLLISDETRKIRSPMPHVPCPIINDGNN